MYDEAVSTFEYIVREGRPVKEILHADYTFLNKPLAKFYGIDAKRRRRSTGRRSRRSTARTRSIAAARCAGLGADDDVGAAAHQPGQARRLDPAPHPRRRRRRRRRPTPARCRPTTRPSRARRCASGWRSTSATPRCAICHLRIDPLGFPLEGFDAVGRTRASLRRRQAGGRDRRVRRQDRRSSAPTACWTTCRRRTRKVLTTLSQQDDRLRARPHAAAVRSAADRRDGRRPAATPRSPTWPRAIVTSRQFRNRGRGADLPPARGAAKRRLADDCRRETTHEPSPSASTHPASFPARRRRRPGAAVAGVAAAVRARPRPRGRSGAASGPPLRLGIVFFSNGVEPAHWWAKGSGATMELGPRPAADAAAPRGHGLHPAACSTSRRSSRPARTSAA